jgi:hypothetical protein
MLKLQYSNANQSWILSWNNITLKICSTKESAAYFLKYETALPCDLITELLEGRALRHMAA